jgi:ferric hydroxamate transport system substrate-binding protein
MKRIIPVSLLLVFILIGCGAPTTPAPTAVPPTTAPTVTAPTSAPIPTTATGTRSVTDFFGTAEIPASPKTIVAADLGAFVPTFGTLSALGVRPVAVTADQLPGYLKPFAEGVQMLPGQPNYEAIAAAKPDLIITPGVDFNKENYELLKKIAPTAAPKWYWQTLEQTTDYWKEVSKLVNKEQEGDKLVSDLNGRIATLRAKYSEPLKGKPISVLQFQGAAMTDVYLLRGRLESALLDAVGAERPANQKFEPNDAEWYVTLSPELLSQADGWAIFLELYSNNPADIPAMQKQLESNPLWGQLEAVKNKRVFVVKTDEWSGTDPFVANLILDAIDHNLGPALGVTGTTPPTGANVPRTVKHVLGETKITGDAKRVIALEWTYVEDLLALGIQPIAIADVEGYKDWVKTPGVELSPDVVDLGQRGEPNLETMLSLKPDLIIEIDYSAAAYYDKLSAIAPTLVFSPYPTDANISTYQEMRDTFLTIADATGKRAEGDAVLKRMEVKFADAKAKLAAAGKGGSKIVLSQAWGAGGDVGIRLFTRNGMAVEVLEKLGLHNGWDDKEFQQYGFSSVSAESLSALPANVNFFYVVQDNDDPFTSTALKPLWDSLPFVKAGHAYPLGGDTWLFGGPLSMELLVDKVTDALTK